MITGVIEHGKSLGRRLGFPTANILPDVPMDALEEEARDGVYAAAIWIGDEPCPHYAMINQGHHPTAPEGKPTIEAYLLDYSGDLYGKRVRVRYLEYLRPERRFESLEALTEQLARDEEATRRIVRQYAADEPSKGDSPANGAI